MTVELPRTTTRIGGPWSRRTEAEQEPRLPQLFDPDPPSDDELAALADRACNDLEAFEALIATPMLLRSVLALLAKRDRQLDWFAALAVRQQGVIERRDERIRTLESEVAAERAEVVRMQEMDAKRCVELAQVRVALTNVAHQLSEAQAALLQLGRQVRISAGIQAAPPPREDFDGGGTTP